MTVLYRSLIDSTRRFLPHSHPIQRRLLFRPLYHWSGGRTVLRKIHDFMLNPLPYPQLTHAAQESSTPGDGTKSAGPVSRNRFGGAHLNSQPFFKKSFYRARLTFFSPCIFFLFRNLLNNGNRQRLYSFPQVECPRARGLKFRHSHGTWIRYPPKNGSPFSRPPLRTMFYLAFARKRKVLVS